MRKHVRETIQAIEATGAVVESVDSSHRHLKFSIESNGHRGRLICPSTPSDWRTRKKVVSTARRFGRTGVMS